MKFALSIFRCCFFLMLVLTGPSLFAQKFAVDPSISPQLFQHDDEITVTYDATGTSLANLSEAYIWVWIPGEEVDAKYNINPATAAAAPAKFVKTVANNKTTFSITFVPSAFFDQSISAFTTMGMLIKGKDWANGQSTDFLVDFWDGTFQLRLLQPNEIPLFVETNENISIKAITPVNANFDLYVNDVLVNESDDIMEYNYVHEVTETSGSATVKLVATAGVDTREVTFQYILVESSPVMARPEGVISGINYYESDPTTVTLCLLAPGKSSVYVRGDFSDWEVIPQNLMKKDGEYFWITLTGLTPETEYGFQYVVDQNLFLADPFADKILDPDDRFIPSSTYPDLKAFPQPALKEEWYFNRVSVFQTGQQPYVWQNTEFEKPDKKDLVIYELLVRDFFADGHRNYQTLIDTLGYFKRLGINAIQLMPIMEFSGNDSWGYNPTFMFAPDKYYGTKEKFKEFIDRCHQEGIAVILDIAMNHQDVPNPYVMMDFNFSTFKPRTTNPWFNVDATHPFSVFFDMNHESPYTQDYLDTVNYYWLKEFNVDGYRFDLSKGFTQVSNPNDVGAWSAKDDSRIALLKRMSDRIREEFPDAILILEHLAENSEEKILADYGFLMWGNLNHAFSQNSMGFATGADLSGTSYKSRGWSEPNLIAYMESHDEERMMFRNLQQGNSSTGYSVRDMETALDRIKAAATFYFAVPGPKMIWQFGELGYDVSIDENGRTGQKPVRWEYYADENRRELFDHFAEMIDLKKSLSIFETTNFTLEGGSGLLKQITLKNEPYTESPSSQEEMNVQVAVNFDVSVKQISVNFPHTGKWYNHFDGKAINVTEIPFPVLLQPGDYKLYTDYSDELVLSTDRENPNQISLYPNPGRDVITVYNAREIDTISAHSLHGATIELDRITEHTWDISTLPAGLYIMKVKTSKGLAQIKFVKCN